MGLDLFSARTSQTPSHQLDAAAMNVPKLLRIALFSVFALLLTGGIMAAQAQVDDPVTVDNDGNEDFLTIQNGLSELDTDADNQGETSGVLEVEAGDYSGDGNLDLSVVSNLETVELRVIQDNEGTGTVDRVITQDVTVDGGLTLNVTSDDGARFLEVQNTVDNVGTGLGGDADIFLGSGAVNIQSSGGIQLADGGEIELTAGFGGSNSLDAPGSLNLTYDASGGNISAGNEIPSNRDLGSSGDLIVDDDDSGNEVTFGGNLTSASFALTGSATFNGSSNFTTSGAFDVSADETLDVGGTLTVNSVGDDEVAVASGSPGGTLTAGSLSITGASTSNGLLDVDGSVTVSDAGVGALTVDNTSVNGNQIINVDGGSLQVTNGGTTLNGTGHTVRVTGDATASLGDVTFEESDPRFNLTGLNTGADGVSVGEVTADVTGDATGNDSSFLEGSGVFTATTGLTLTAVDPNTSNDETDAAAIHEAEVRIDDDTDGDFDLGDVTLNEVDDQTNSGTAGTITPAVDLNVQDGGNAEDQGRITAAGSEFQDVTTAASGDGTITFAGNSETKITGSLTNNGLVNVDSEVRFDASSVEDAGNLPADNNGGEINVAQNTLFIVDAAGTSDNDVVLDNNNTSSAGGVTGNGTLRFLSADGNTHVVNADDDGHAFPATVQHQAGANGSGTLEIRVTSTSSGGEDVTVSFGGGSGDLTADQDITFNVVNNTGTDEISEIEAGTVTANARLDARTGAGAIYTSSPTIDLNTLKVTAGTASLPGAASLTATADGSGEIRVTGGTLNAGVASITADDIVATGGTLDATAPSVLSSASTINNSVTSSGGSIDLSGATASIDIVEGTAVSGGGSIDLSGLMSAVVTTRDLTISNGNGGGTVNVEGSTLDITRDFSRAGASSSVLTTDNSSIIRFVNPSSGGAQEGQFDPGAQFTVNGEIVVDKVNTKLTLLSPIRINGDLTIKETGNQFADDPELDLSDNLIFGNDNASTPQGGTFTINGTLTTQPGNKVIFRAPGAGDYNIVGNSKFRNVQNVSGQDILIGQNATSNLTFTGTLDLETGGVEIKNISDLSPASSGSPVVRRDVTSSTQITTASNSDSFNDLANTYGLTYDGSGSGNAADELTDQVDNLTVASPTTVTVNESNVDDLTGPDDDVTVSTITIDGELNSKNSGPGETITVTGTSHSVSGSMLARLDIDTDGATVTGSTGDDADSELGEVRVLSGSDNAEITNIKKVGGDVTVGLTTGSDADLDVSLVEDTDGPTSPSQTITGSVTLDGSDFGIGSPVTVQGDIAANSGSVSLGDNNLTVADANFTGASGVSYSAGSGFLVMEDDESSASTNTITTAGETVVNLRSTTDGDGGGEVDDTELNGSVDVSGTLDIENTIDTDASSETLTFSNSGSDQAILDNATAFSGSGSFEAQGTEIVMTQATSISNFVIDASGSTVTLSDDPNASPSGPFTLTVGSGFTMEAGIFDHTDNTVDLTAPDGFTVASGFSPSTSASDIQSDADTFFGISGGGSTTLNSDVSFDRLDVNSNDLSLSDDGHNLTVNEELILSKQFDGRSGDDDDDIVIADGATIERPNGNEGDPLTEPPTFLGDVTLEYTDGSNNTTSDDEVPSSSSSARVDNLIVDVQGQTFSLEETGAVTGNVVVTESVDLQEGTIEHNKTSGNSQGSNTGRRIELDGSDVTFFQRDGSIASNDANTGNLLATSNYTLVYRPEGGDITTTDREFRTGGSVSSLQFEDGTNTASNSNLELHEDRTVGGVTVNRTDGNSQFNLSSSALTVNGSATVTDGEIIDLSDDGNVASINTNGLTVEDGLIDGKDTGSQNSGDGVDLTASGTFEVTGGEVEGSDIDADGAFEATGGTLDGVALTADGDVDLSGATLLDDGAGENDAGNLNITFNDDADQSLKISGEETLDNVTVAQRSVGNTVTVSDPSGGEGVLTVGGSSVSDDETEGLVLENGLLASTEQTVPSGESPVEIRISDGGTVTRDVDSEAISHIVGPLTQGVSAGSESQTIRYPVGTADGTFRNFRFKFPDGLDQGTDITVEHVNADPGSKEGYPIESEFSDGSDGTFNLSSDYTPYYWDVSSDQDLGLNQQYQVFAQADGLTFGEDVDSDQFRLIRRANAEGVQTDWSLIGSGAEYSNIPLTGSELNVRTDAATESILSQGARFAVTSPAGADEAPAVATNSGLTVTQDESGTIGQGDLEATDANDDPADLTYTVTSGPSQGEIQVDGSQSTTFTQADVNADQVSVSYDHNASSSDNDSFEFEVENSAGLTASGTFDITVEAGQVAISGSVEYPTEGDGALAEGRPLSGEGFEVVATPSSGGDPLPPVTPNENGAFTIDGLSQGTDYDVTVEVSASADAGVINVFDAQRVVIGSIERVPFAGPFQEEVANVTKDDNTTREEDRVTSRDALAILLNSGLNDGEESFAAGEWAATEQTVTAGTDEEANLRVAQYGDADLNGGNGSNNNNSTTTLALSESEQSEVAARTAASAAASSADVKAEAGETFEVPVRVEGDASIGAYDLQFSYDEENVSFEGASVASGELFTDSEEGAVGVSWLDETGESPLSASDGSPVVTLSFTAEEGVEEESLGLEVSDGRMTDPSGSTIRGATLSAPTVSVGAVAPEKFALKGNYPNPIASGQATIEMDLPSSASVTVEVYNTLGQQVMSTTQSMQAGSGQTVKVDGSQLSSGQYFYRVKADLKESTVRETGRMTVVR
ncbi:cadherin-like domain-containing protein [Salinibacter ruber]|uniref:cadherin-like domain-containing protein n=1 Tax=Salinibacter ruber TaxID=146919 RepID=UPI002072DC11|nr:cadherin-like domain-containing protein [Salinibacter ruber]